MRHSVRTGQELLAELSLEAAVTRRFLEKVPFDSFNFKPTEESEALGPLAIHVAEIIAWWKACLEADELDFLHFSQKQVSSTKELLDYFDQLLTEAKEALAEVREEELSNPWSMRHGDDVLFTLPKKQVLRLFCMNHLVHHRAQLGVYLRLLGITHPATYGPSSDDDEVILIKSYQY